MSDSSGDEEATSVGQFLDDYYPHFAIMGIFGTIALFLSGNLLSSESELIARGGIFAVLAIFAYTAAWVGWKALTELLTGLHEAKRHLGTELGYVLIVLSTFTLALTVGNQIISSYSEIRQIAVSIGALAFGIILYVRNYPIDRYSIGELKPSNVAFVALILMIGVTNPYREGLQFILNSRISEHWLREIFTVYVFAAVHLSMSEYTVMIRRVMDYVNEQKFIVLLNKIATVKTIRWDYSLSVGISVTSIIIFTIIVEEFVLNHGMVELLGYQWKTAISYQFLILVSLISLTIWFKPWSPKQRDVVARNVSIVFVIVCFVQLVGLFFINL